MLNPYVCNCEIVLSMSLPCVGLFGLRRNILELIKCRKNGIFGSGSVSNLLHYSVNRLLCSKYVNFASGSVSNRLHYYVNRLHCLKFGISASGSASNRLHYSVNRLHLTVNFLLLF